MGYLGSALELGAFFVSFLAANVILIKKLTYGVQFKISPVEIRLMVQGIFVVVPLAFVSVTGMWLSKELNSSVVFYSFWHVMAALIPAVHLLVWIAFNP
ncbi:hypothetical protein L596_029313 [Steinernema carpocapsae]|uniref:7TM GPCR serpentine receptor class x (Srx) domain-containing protein n=1 Tax=Steinernema carpocapsae TaxID=34508 RepID=A0A4V5ZXF7_STECR|nr:hypothetical protein L596_029313 [Steinernema carpocapsae]